MHAMLFVASAQPQGNAGFFICLKRAATTKVGIVW